MKLWANFVGVLLMLMGASVTIGMAAGRLSRWDAVWPAYCVFLVARELVANSTTPHQEPDELDQS